MESNLFIIGERYTEEISDLKKLGVKLIPAPNNPDIQDEICNHIDLLAFTFPEGIIVIDECIAGEIVPFLTDYKIIVCSDIKSPYPNDVKLNAAIVGKRLICNTKHIHPVILDKAQELGYEVIHTNQGYAKCNICVLTCDAVITSDAGICETLKEHGVDVLKISEGNIQLSESHYGFIGGASAKIYDDVVYFSGDFTAHPDYIKISSFLQKHKIKAVYNDKRPLRDFGGIISL
ncbi:MAG: hypothetical protein IIV19_03795 [Bacteroidaceae bacterium]|nr:hypothetical protein [Bacteroidaceae bacterium]